MRPRLVQQRRHSVRDVCAGLLKQHLRDLSSEWKRGCALREGVAGLECLLVSVDVQRLEAFQVFLVHDSNVLVSGACFEATCSSVYGGYQVRDWTVKLFLVV